MAIKLTSFKQQVTLNASVDELFEQIMDSKKHSDLSGAKAVIGKKVGDSFSVYDGYAYGKNLKIIPGKLIVQSWRAHEEKWPEECMSEVIFEFKKVDKTKSKIVFTHKNIPAVVAETFKKGWIDYYWSLLKMKYNKTRS
ncbi:MAG: SRPBCC domain-containing protein [Bacteroidetes bacterium]|nr:SRPBCC domain-containing protein [Bacteroidota bacterium]